MSRTGKQDLDEALASPEALQKQLGDWERRLRVKTWIHGASAALFLIAMGAVLWLLFANPSKATEAAGAAIACGLIGIFQAILAISSHVQTRAARNCQALLQAKGEQLDQN